MSYKMKSSVDSLNRGRFPFPTAFLIVCVLALVLSFRSVFAAEIRTYGPPTPAPTLNVKSYSQWKAEKIQALGSKIQDLQQKQKDEKSKEAMRLKEAESFEVENMNMAQKLKISDYLITYIFSFSNRKAALKEAAALMSPAEVAEVMEAYAHSLAKKDSGSTSLTADLIRGY